MNKHRRDCEAAIVVSLSVALIWEVISHQLSSEDRNTTVIQRLHKEATVCWDRCHSLPPLIFPMMRGLSAPNHQALSHTDKHANRKLTVRHLVFDLCCPLLVNLSYGSQSQQHSIRQNGFSFPVKSLAAVFQLRKVFTPEGHII